MGEKNKQAELDKRTGKESTAGIRQRDGKQWQPMALGLKRCFPLAFLDRG